MRVIGRILLFGIAMFMTIMCIGGVFSLVEFFRYADFQQGKIVVTSAMLFLAAAFGIGAYQCYKMAFRKGDTLQRQGTADLPAAEIPKQHAKEVSPTCGAVPDDFAVSIDTMHQEVPQEFPKEVLAETDNELMPKGQEAIPDEVKGLLWIKGEGLTYEHNMLNEPSLIDMDLEIKQAADGLVQDIGYYPSYRNLKAENRYVYLNWLRDVTAPIPIGYVFIFYYGLERHLLFGKFEQAFDMIVKLRLFHNNSSFYAYSSDALLIAALYHRRSDMISKIDLNKATSKLAQFVIASLTGKIESSLLIENCAEVGFTNKRYIKSDYGLFREALDKALQEKFGDVSYPVAEGDFLKCAGTFPLVLANYSLRLEERIASAPDLSTNGEYKKNVFSLLNEAHERVKAYKREERAKGGGADGESNASEGAEVKAVQEKPKEIDIQDYADVQQEYDFVASHVTYSTTSHGNIPFSLEEEIFFKALIKAMKENKLWDKEGLRLTRLANGTFNANCRTCYIGKVKLCNKMSIQVQRGSTQVKSYSITELAEALDKIPAWIRYIKYCRREQKIFDKLLET